MTPEQSANHNIALLMTIAVIVGAFAYAGHWLLTSDHSIAVRFRALMSRWHIIADDEEPTQVEQRSHAVERPREHSGTVAGNDVPDLAEQLSKLDDAAILDILSRVRDDDGEYRYAESRVAKFIPGRVEENLAAVRDVRGTEKPAPAGRVLRVRDNNGERVIPFR